MSKEEKKAIKYLKNEIERVNKENNFKKIPRDIVCLPLFIDYAETLLNLIEKLQKENEKLQKEIERQGNVREIEEEYIEKKFISKDKIREKIETLKKEATDRLNEGRENIFVTKRLIIDILDELLEEK